MIGSEKIINQYWAINPLGLTFLNKSFMLPMNQKPRILLAEDDAIFRRFVVLLLEKAGYEVVVANNGGDALRLLQTNRPPDLLLLDLLMPELSGLEIIEKLKGLPQAIPVILMSAAELPMAAKTIAQSSRTPYLIKPFQPDVLLATIEKVIAPSRI
ncbi:response regulator [Larkinella sp. C7]|uniref:response regulator n=1 Tax=Larkinella sp. C7 TaxID=2576607 RepID=UPI0011113319|nr:response regulator [Larkinella sp. C7]